MAKRGQRSALPDLPRQRRFDFVERTERLDRLFRRAILALTFLSVVALLAGTPTGRDAAFGAFAWARRVARGAVGLPPPRAEIDAEWSRTRRRAVEQASVTFHRVYDEAPPPVQRLMRYAGMGRDTALLRWGNFDKILVLPSAVFAPDDSGRSYRLRPNLRSVWLGGVNLTHGMNGFFLVPDTPDLPFVLEGTSARVIPGTVQTTNSWGCRGPEPDPSAPLRGLILGDSTMQGYFVGDAQTPPARLAHHLETLLGTRVSLLNTGHLGYSPEQYYHSLAEYAERFHPHFVLAALCVNDFGDVGDVIQGRGDWDEAKYWLDRIDEYCRTRGILYVASPVPYDGQVTGLRLGGNYPGRVDNLLRSSSLHYCFPIEDLVDEFVRLRHEAKSTGRIISPNPLYNLHLDDHHFSPIGSDVWARTLGRRIAGLLMASRDRGLLRF
jgi:hypothetical protein